MMRFWGFVLCGVLSVGGVGLQKNVMAEEVVPYGQLPHEVAARKEALLKKAREIGRVKVIMTLALPVSEAAVPPVPPLPSDDTPPEPDAYTPPDEKAIAAVQTAFLKRHELSENNADQAIIRFMFIPSMGAMLNEDELRRVMDDPVLTHIQEDIPASPF